MGTLFLRVCAALVIALSVATPAAAQDKPTMVVSLTSAEVFPSQAAFDLARQIQHGGGKVVVYLNVDAVRLANNRTRQPVGAISGKTAHDYIAEIIADGGRVFVCTVCIQQAGLGMRDRIDGVQLGGQALREIMMAPNTRILSF